MDEPVPILHDLLPRQGCPLVDLHTVIPHLYEEATDRLVGHHRLLCSRFCRDHPFDAAHLSAHSG